MSNAAIVLPPAPETYSREDQNNVRHAIQIALSRGGNNDAVLDWLVNPMDYGAVGDGATNDASAIASADAYAVSVGKTLLIARSFRVTSNVTIASPVFFVAGGRLSPTTGVTITIRTPVDAPLVQVFGTDGCVLLGGDVYPQWFGTIADRAYGSWTVATARADTLGLRKACKSYATEFVQQQAAYLLFRTIVPAGFYQIANGFTVPFGQACIGSGTGTTKIQCAEVFADPLEAEWPVMTVGPVFTGSGMSMTQTATNGVYGDQPSSCVQRFFIESDSGSRPAMWLSQIAGVHVSSIFTSSSAIHIKIDASDVVMSDIICDIGLSQIVLNQANNVQINNLLCFLGTYHINITGPSRDVTISNFRSEYAQFASLACTGQNALNINVNGFQIVGNSQYGSYQGAFYIGDNNNEIIVRNGVVRNIPGSFYYSDRAGAKFTAENVTLDQLKTNPAYTQGTVMRAVNGDFMNVQLRNVDMFNFAVTPITVGINAGTLRWFGGRQSGGTFSGRIINALQPGNSVILSGVDGGNKALSVYGSGLVCNRFRNVHIQADLGDNDVTLDSLTDSEVQAFYTSLTADRTCGLSTTNAVRGDKFRVIRYAGGAHTLTVGGLWTFASGKQGSVDGEFDGTLWRLTAASAFN